MEKVKFTLVLSLLICIGQMANAQNPYWKSFEAPKHPIASALWANPNTGDLVVQGVNEYYSSTDNGKTWFPWAEVNGEKITSAQVSFYGDTLFILSYTQSSGIGEIYSSDDMGMNWSLRSSSQISEPFGIRPQSFLLSNGKVYIGVTDSVMRSSDFGNTYSKFAVDVKEFFNTIKGPLFEYDGDLYGVEGRSGVYRSTDDAETWQEVTGVANPAVYDYAIENGKLYVSTYNGASQLYDNKLGWRNKKYADITVYHDGLIMVDGSTMILSHREGLVLSRDTGNTFSKLDMNRVPKWDKSITGLVKSGDYYVVAGRFGVLRAHKDTLDFYSVHNGFEQAMSSINALLPLDNGKFMISTASGVYVGDENSNYYIGSSFTQEATVHIEKFKDDHFILFSRSFWVLQDDGLNWEEKMTGLPSIIQIYDYAIDDSKLILATSDGLYETTDLSSWTKLQISYPQQPYAAIHLSGDRIFLATAVNDSLYTANYSDLEFSNISGNWEGASFDQITNDGNRLFVLSDRKVYRNNGFNDDNWEESVFYTDNTQLMVWYSPIVVNNAALFIGTRNGPMSSVDAGKTWDLMRDSLDFGNFGLSLGMVKNDTLYGFNSSTVFYYPVGELASRREYSEQEGLSFYPNPAVESINFGNEIESIRLYNTRGQLVLERHNSEKISIKGLNPGLYLMHYQDKGRNGIEKVIISR